MVFHVRSKRNMTFSLATIYSIIRGICMSLRMLFVRAIVCHLKWAFRNIRHVAVQRLYVQT